MNTTFNTAYGHYIQRRNETFPPGEKSHLLESYKMEESSFAAKVAANNEYAKWLESAVFSGTPGVTVADLARYSKIKGEINSSPPIFSHWLAWKYKCISFREYFKNQYQEYSKDVAISKWISMKNVIRPCEIDMINVRIRKRGRSLPRCKYMVKFEESELGEKFFMFGEGEIKASKKTTDVEIYKTALKLMLKEQKEKTRGRMYRGFN